MAAREHIEVDVDGGALFVASWGTAAAPTVVAVHGITANHAAWQWVADELESDLRLVAPDLRGRGASAGVGGGYGLERHAADVVAILDTLGRDRAVVVGHSMGAYVAAVVAAQYPERVAAVVMVDGGLSLPLGAGIDVDEFIAAVLGPALSRLDLTFESEEAYFAFWAEHPAFRSAVDALDERTLRYLRWDLGGEPPAVRSRVVRDAVMTDGRDLVGSDAVATAPERIDVPVVLLRAPRGLLDEPNPLLPDALVDVFRDRFGDLRDRVIPDTNHYSIVMGAGAAEVAGAIRGLVR